MHHLREQPPPGVRRQDADPGDAGGGQPGTAGHGRVESECGDVANTPVTLPGSQRVAVLPRRQPLVEHFVVHRSAQQRSQKRIGGGAPLADVDGTNVEVAHTRTLSHELLRRAPDFVR